MAKPDDTRLFVIEVADLAAVKLAMRDGRLTNARVLEGGGHNTRVIELPNAGQSVGLKKVAKSARLA